MPFCTGTSPRRLSSSNPVWAFSSRTSRGIWLNHAVRSCQEGRESARRDTPVIRGTGGTVRPAAGDMMRVAGPPRTRLKRVPAARPARAGPPQHRLVGLRRRARWAAPRGLAANGPRGHATLHGGVGCEGGSPPAKRCSPRRVFRDSPRDARARKPKRLACCPVRTRWVLAMTHARPRVLRVPRPHLVDGHSRLFRRRGIVGAKAHSERSLGLCGVFPPARRSNPMSVPSPPIGACEWLAATDGDSMPHAGGAVRPAHGYPSLTARCMCATSDSRRQYVGFLIVVQPR